jgi:hypothetical protein
MLGASLTEESPMPRIAALVTALFVSPILALTGQDTGVVGAPAEAAKSEGTALGWSLGGTVVPIAVGALLGSRQTNPALGATLEIAGVLIGPSLDHFSAGRSGRGAATIALRAAFAAGVVLLGPCWDECVMGDLQRQTVVTGVFGVLTAASMVYDLVTAPRSARRHNQERASLSIFPARVANRPALAAQLTVRF